MCKHTVILSTYTNTTLITKQVDTQFYSMLYLAEEVSLLLSVGEAGQVAADHQVRVIQQGVEPTPGGQQGLDTQKKPCQQHWTILLTVVTKTPDHLTISL